MKIGVKIALLIGVGVVGIVMPFIMTMTALDDLESMFQFIGTKASKNSILTSRMLADMNTAARQTAIMSYEDLNKREARWQIVATVNADLQASMDTLKDNAVNPRVQEICQQFDSVYAETGKLRQRFEQLIRTEKIHEAMDIRRHEYQDAVNATEALLKEISDITDQQVQDYSLVQSAELVSSTYTKLIITAIVVFVLLVVVGVIILGAITGPLKKAVAAANKVAEGDLKVDLTSKSKDETGILMHSLEEMVGSINALLKDTDDLAKAAVSGKLEVRAEGNKHKGAYKDLIEGINEVLDAVIGPLNVTAEYVDRISKGDIPPRITDSYNGDFNEIKNNLNGCMDAITLLVAEINQSIKHAVDGDFTYRADANKFHGNFKTMMVGVNQLVEAFIEPLHMTSAFLQAAADGDNVGIKNVTKDYKGDFNTIKNSINKLHDTLFLVLNEMISTADEAKKGNLSKKADSSKVQGAWIVIMDGLNSITGAANAIISDAGGVLATMATGDLTPRIIKEYHGKFEEMKDNINNLGDSLSDLISRLTDAIHTTATASAEISATAETIATATQEQSSQTDEVAGAVEEMSRTVTDNAQNAAKTADVAKKSGDTANKGGKVVEHTVAKMREISSVVKSSAANIAKLGESSKKIGEIIGVIDDIADQTNLLSLNAAIEAARAGEQGRGFAVVADSVGKLAISTASATKEIAEMIKGIQSDTEAAVKAMEKGTAEVQSGIELADTAGTAIKDIVTGIDELLNMVNQIATASDEQSATSEEIAKNVSSISKVVADSAHNIEDVASTANELARMTETLTSLISQFKINDNSKNHHSAGAFASSNDDDDYPSASSSGRYLN